MKNWSIQDRDRYAQLVTEAVELGTEIEHIKQRQSELLRAAGQIVDKAREAARGQ